MIPKFIPIDLSKSDKHEHPDIRTDGTLYLAKHDGEWIIGTFDRQWYGLNFNWFWSCVAGLQFDAPGFNSSRWQELYEMVTPKKGKKTRKRK